MQGDKSPQFGGRILRDGVAQLFKLPSRQLDGGLKAQTLFFDLTRFNGVMRNVVQSLLQ